MKSFKFLIGAVAAIGLLFSASNSVAQCASGDCGVTAGSCNGGCAVGGTGTGGCNNCQPGDWGGGYTGETSPTCMKHNRIHPGPVQAIWLADRDRFAPKRCYPYSHAGINASWVHEWNKQQMNCKPWHGQYAYWRYQQPTALVVPPTAAFQTSYAWGVGQTKSLPINHQFGNYGAGGVEAAPGQFQPTPYWPSSTNQFGVYPVRSPW